jgi:hypothetical protein
MGKVGQCRMEFTAGGFSSLKIVLDKAHCQHRVKLQYIKGKKLSSLCGRLAVQGRAHV